MKRKKLIKIIKIIGLIILGLLIIFLFLNKAGVFNKKERDFSRPEVLYNDVLLNGTAEEKEMVLSNFIFKINNFKENAVPIIRQTSSESLIPLIPIIIEFTLDDTELPKRGDTGWGNVYHMAATALNSFSYKVDGIHRDRNTDYSFFNIVGTADYPHRKIVHDNWVSWWTLNKDYLVKAQDIRNIK